MRGSYFTKIFVIVVLGFALIFSAAFFSLKPIFLQRTLKLLQQTAEKYALTITERLLKNGNKIEVPTANLTEELKLIDLYLDDPEKLSVIQAAYAGEKKQFFALDTKGNLLAFSGYNKNTLYSAQTALGLNFTTFLRDNLKYSAKIEQLQLHIPGSENLIITAAVAAKQELGLIYGLLTEQPLVTENTSCDLSDLQEQAKHDKFFKHGMISIFPATGQEDNSPQSKIIKAGEKAQEGHFYTKTNDIPVLLYYKKAGDYYLSIEIPQEDIFLSKKSIIIIVSGLLLLSILLSLTLTLIVTSTTAASLKKINNLISALSEKTAEGRLRLIAVPKHTPPQFLEIAQNINGIIISIVRQFDNLAVPFIIVDNNFQIQFLNDKAVKFLKLEKSNDAIGKKCYQFSKGEICRREHCPTLRALETEREETEENIILIDGQKHIVKITAVPVYNKDGMLIGAAETIVDQTVLAQAIEHNIKEVALLNGDIQKITETINNALTDNLSLDFTDETLQNTLASEKLSLLKHSLNGVFGLVNDTMGLLKQVIGLYHTGTQQFNLLLAEADSNLGELSSAQAKDNISILSIVQENLRNVNDLLNAVAEGLKTRNTFVADIAMIMLKKVETLKMMEKELSSFSDNISETKEFICFLENAILEIARYYQSELQTNVEIAKSLPPSITQFIYSMAEFKNQLAKTDTYYDKLLAGKKALSSQTEQHRDFIHQIIEVINNHTKSSSNAIELLTDVNDATVNALKAIEVFLKIEHNSLSTEEVLQKTTAKIQEAMKISDEITLISTSAKHKIESLPVPPEDV